MTRPHPIRQVRFSDQFLAQLKKQSWEVQIAARQPVKDFVQDPHPEKYRLGKQTPDAWTIHVTRNHSHKTSFELVGYTAVLRKIGTHNEIDRAP